MLHQNRLAEESSLYLQQHAHNPVSWYPWGDEAWEKARSENKLVLISVGYSSCHWCHVMEHESFENEQVAELMNAFFVCIKVDREERPDIDQVYMTAVQLMTGQGGWPLNCFTLPDGRPIYGGTYFRKHQWMQILERLQHLHKNEPERMLEYAGELTDGVQKADLLPSVPKPWDENVLLELIKNWKKRFDMEEGGMSRAPKFPMPDNYRFLLQYVHLSRDKEVMDHLSLTLWKMYHGGLYDQVGGGFYRYSTDMLWKVPHFEKMLYDNAQLISLYAEFYMHVKEEWAKKCVVRTADFMLETFLLPEGGFASAMDADSEGEEGKYYVWDREELYDFLEHDEADFIADHLSFNQHGFWEGKYIPLIRSSDYHQQRAEGVLEKMKVYRSQRVAPVLDTKMITAWNGQMICGLVDAFRATQDERYLEAAIKSWNFLLERMYSRGKLKRIWNGNYANVDGFLDDYVFVAEAGLSLYQITGEAAYFHRATELVEYCIAHFSHADGVMAYYTSNDAEILINRTTEIQDNVIPSSNAVLADLLYRLGAMNRYTVWMERAEKMLQFPTDDALWYGSAYSRWGRLALTLQRGLKEVAITGPDAIQNARSLLAKYLPDLVVAASEGDASIPLLEGRAGEELRFFVCQEMSCDQPVFTINDVLQSLK